MQGCIEEWYVDVQFDIGGIVQMIEIEVLIVIVDVDEVGECDDLEWIVDDEVVFEVDLQKFVVVLWEVVFVQDCMIGDWVVDLD